MIVSNEGAEGLQRGCRGAEGKDVRIAVKCYCVERMSVVSLQPRLLA